MKNVFSGIKAWIVELKIRNKLLLAFLVLSFVPMLLIASINYGMSKRVLEEKTNRYSHDILLQAAGNIENKLDKIEDISFSILFDTELQSQLQKAKDGRLDAYERSRVQTGVESVLAAQILYHNEIDAAFVASVGGYVYALDKTKQGYGVLEQEKDTILDAGGSSVWFSCENENVVAVARAINSVVTQRTLGYLVMYVDSDFFLDTLADVQSVMGGELCLIDREGLVLAGRESAPTNVVMDMTHEAFAESYSFNAYKLDGQSVYRAASERMENGWRIVATVPVQAYEREIISLRNLTLLITMVLFLLTILCAWQVSGSISQPIQNLTQAMTRFGGGDLTVRYATTAKDEVGLCAEAFSKMAENIGQLIEKVYAEQLMKRDAELKTLRMQINPHFLYNTLDTINWMARTSGNTDICVMVKSLGDLMRATINGGDFISIRDEMKSLGNYLTIQEYRYKDKFQTIFEIAPDTEELYIPKMILQPLVENAIYHGIEPLFEPGWIKITTVRKEHLLQIEVSDNGAGMSEETVQQLLNGQDNNLSGRGSIGVQNVIKRVKKLYGENYGLTITSDFGEGTTIHMDLPATFKIKESDD